MKNLLVAALAGSIASAQVIDVNFFNSQPDPSYTIATDAVSQNIPYDRAATIAKDEAEFAGDELPLDKVQPEKRNTPMRIERRQAGCSALPVTPNQYNADLSSAAAFQKDAKLASQAQNAATPAGYVVGFQNRQAAGHQAQGYMGFVRQKTYDTTACAKECNKRQLCQSFNLYFERSPQVVPGDGCENPDATASIICSLWGGPLFNGNDLNIGQWRRKFQTAIAGSNGYVKSDKINQYSLAAIKAPEKDCNNEDPFIGMRAFTDNAPFDPARCAAVCKENNDVAAKESTRATKLCRFYNTYILNKNNQTQGVVCALYTREFAPSEFATNTGTTDPQGNRFTIVSSITSAFTGVAPATCGPAPSCLEKAPLVPAKGSLTSAETYNDRYSRTTIDTPFPFCVFSVCVRQVKVSIEGFIEGDVDNSNTFTIDVLNSAWIITGGQPQYIAIATCGPEGKRESKIEWRVQARDYMNDDGPIPGIYRFSATFFEDTPGRIILSYPELAGDQRGSNAMYDIKNGNPNGFLMGSFDVQAGDRLLFQANAQNSFKKLS